MDRNRLRFTAAACALMLASAPSVAHEAADQPSGAASLHVAQDDEIGQYLVDQEGMSLYLFEADTRGTADAAAESTCHEDCARAWPPLLTEGDPDVHDELSPEMLGTITREHGDTQVTYDGWPLYYYAADYSAGHHRGHDIEGFGAEWYLVSPEGGKAGEEH